MEPSPRPSSAMRPLKARLHPAVWSLLILLLSGIAVAAFYVSQERVAGTPDLVVPTLDNETFALSNERGRVVVLDFFQVYCSSCVILEENLKQVAPEWNVSDVRLVSVGFPPDNDFDTLRDYRAEHGLNWTVASDLEGRAFADFDVIAFPTLLVVDARGEIVYRNAGIPSADQLRAAVAQAQAQSAAPVEFARYSLWSLAVAGAFASFFSPCAIGLLPGYVAHTLRFSGPVGTNPMRRAASLGGVAALGLLLVFLGMGALAYAFGRAVAPVLRGLAPFAGLALIFVGLLLLVRPYSLFLQRFFSPLTQIPAQAGEPTRRGSVSHFLYGMGYGAGAAGCTAPVLLTLFVLAASAGPLVGAGVVLVWAVTAAVLLAVVTLVVAGSREGASRWIQRYAKRVEIASAFVIMGSGAFLLWYSWKGGVLTV